MKEIEVSLRPQMLDAVVDAVEGLPGGADAVRASGALPNPPEES